MEKFYTVDRLSTLKSGDEIKLEKHKDISPAELQNLTDTMFPDGLSLHGERYFIHKSSHSMISEPSIELMFEHYRKAYHPDKPSRFQCMFACESIEEAKNFRDNFGKPEHNIYEVLTTGRTHKGNMTLLTSNNTILVQTYFAEIYWQGSSIKEIEDFQEVLLELPVKIGKKVL